MTQAVEAGSTNDHLHDEPHHVAKSRSCLMCRQNFNSAWAGERVCKKCKQQNQWRTGRSSLAA